MKRFLAILLLAIVFAIPTKADEGMWIPSQLEKRMAEMQRLGLQLTSEQIYSLADPSIKDAVVIFGGGCTGEVISAQGLVLTNHHCGYGAIQSVSTVEQNHLRDGFWAASFDQEIPIRGLSVTFVVRIDDVTQKVLDGVTDTVDEKQRAEIIRKNSTTLEKAATNGTHYTAAVREYFEGNQYFLLVYEIFRDIRLVGTPPESIGKFGGDTDNWMWPRHTGDFSLFRIYAGADNKPAEYNKNNQPFQPRHFLPISLDGVKKDNFAMIMGNPGSTDRYLTSWGVRMAIDETNPTRVKIRAEKLRIMREGMEASEKVRIQYASKYAGVANYWKYFIGQTRGLKRLDVIDKKLAIEEQFRNNLQANPSWERQFGQAFPLIEQAYDKLNQYNLARWYMVEAILSGPEILSLAGRFNRLAELLEAKQPDAAAIKKETERLKQGLEAAYKNYDLQVDRQMMAQMFEMYYKAVPAEFRPELLETMLKKHKGSFQALAADVFARSNFASAAKVSQLLDKATLKALNSDPAFNLAKAFGEINTQIQQATAEPNAQLRKGNRLFVAGLMAMHPERDFYPNANRTLRLTYGTVQDYYPADAVHYNYVTTQKGILEKEDPQNHEFIVHPRLKSLIESNDFGPYADNEGTLIVNFLTNHDITGGNSGSPVIDAQGRLIGCAFDGNWEAMSGDIAYEAELQRTISVDIRYVLFIIDKFAGATNLIDELVIYKDGKLVKR